MNRQRPLDTFLISLILFRVYSFPVKFKLAGSLFIFSLFCLTL